MCIEVGHLTGVLLSLVVVPKFSAQYGCPVAVAAVALTVQSLVISFRPVRYNIFLLLATTFDFLVLCERQHHLLRSLGSPIWRRASDYRAHGVDREPQKRHCGYEFASGSRNSRRIHRRRVREFCLGRLRPVPTYRRGKALRNHRVRRPHALCRRRVSFVMLQVSILYALFVEGRLDFLDRKLFYVSVGNRQIEFRVVPFFIGRLGPRFLWSFRLLWKSNAAWQELAA